MTEFLFACLFTKYLIKLKNNIFGILNHRKGCAGNYYLDTNGGNLIWQPFINLSTQYLCNKGNIESKQNKKQKQWI